jgi:oligopeptidase B
MKNILRTIGSASLIFVAACSTPDKEDNTPTMPQPPIAKKVAEELTIHGDTRIDNYFWMRLSDAQKEAETPDAQTQDVLDYLNAENDYAKAMMADTDSLQEKLYNEIVGRIKQDDQSVPVKVDGYWYYTRFEEGQDYALYCRKKGSLDAAEEIMLNGPEMGAKYSYFSIGTYGVSTNNNLIAYSVDTVSRRQYTIYFKDLTTGQIFEDEIPNTTGGATWANDNKTIFYSKQDPVTLRSFQIYRHTLGTPVADDVLVYQEDDETFSCGIGKSKSKEYLLIGSSSTMSDEWHFLDANNPTGEWKVIQARERGLEYSVSQYQGDFYIVNNIGAQNFKISKAPIANPGKASWTDVIAHREDVLVEGLSIFKDFLVIEERKAGLAQIRIRPWTGKDEHYIEFQDPAYTAYVAGTPEFDTNIIRYGYSSLTTPSSTYDYDVVARTKELLKQQEVVDASFSVDNYTSERIMVPARDGAMVPMSIVYRKDLDRSKANPLLLYAYGSYGASMDAYFSSVRLSLLDRGFIYVIAHIRGGQEMGRAWYEDGKLLKKKNTFTDYIDCADFLVKQNYTSPDHLYAMGGSAGGLLMGAVINMRPELWNGVIAAVPFVDVISTMLDESIPLTTGEFDEWGNPKDSVYYDYIKSYSPYDNIEAKNYPNMLVTTGYWDSQVQYWEPAKWVAKLRELKTDNNILLLSTNMEAGHGGASGRFRRFRETALEYAFLLKLEGITE